MVYGLCKVIIISKLTTFIRRTTLDSGGHIYGALVM